MLSAMTPKSQFSICVLVNADYFLGVDGLDDCLDGRAVGMTGCVDIHYVVEHLSELLVLRIDFHLLWLLIISVPR